MEIIAFASFVVLVVAWVFAPSRGGVATIVSRAEDRKAA
jgi:hypothetical protein